MRGGQRELKEYPDDELGNEGSVFLADEKYRLSDERDITHFYRKLLNEGRYSPS